MTLPSAAETRLSGNALSAYNVCLGLEKIAKDRTEKERIQARVLGYLIIHAPSPTATSELLNVIHSCSNDHDKLFKLGEALPRIAIMAPPNFVRIDIWAPITRGKPYRPLMYHHSLMAQLACLRNVNILCLVGFRFIHLIELRCLVACFTGLRSAIFEVEVDPDRPGEFRLLQRATNPVLSRVTHIPPGM